MSMQQEPADSRDGARFTRLNALYETYCRQGGLSDTSREGDPQDVIEVPCELAPEVRRRIKRRAA
jgi:hypothetical protein